MNQAAARIRSRDPRLLVQADMGNSDQTVISPNILDG